MNGFDKVARVEGVRFPSAWPTTPDIAGGDRASWDDYRRSPGLPTGADPSIVTDANAKDVRE